MHPLLMTDTTHHIFCALFTWEQKDRTIFTDFPGKYHAITGLTKFPFHTLKMGNQFYLGQTSL